MPLTRRFDPTTADGQRIAVLARRLLALGTHWPGSATVGILNEWFVETLGIDPEGSVYQADTTPPCLVSPDATIENVTERLLDAGHPLHDPHRPDHANEFTVTTDPACCGGDCVTVTLPYARPSRARFAVSWLRQAGYDAAEHNSRPSGGRLLHVHHGVIRNIPADAPAEIRAAQYLWFQGFTSPITHAHLHAEVPGPTPPVPVTWRPGWLSIDIAAPLDATARQRKKTATAIADAFRTADWQVDRRGPEALHIHPPITP
ncbi:hypothetical protein [Streptomyces sp. NBC_00439]|uniref:hypothetical protein n=1 Tax=Streptomyces sp. NBC_00439 TaxID=2903650 RepID=UPI00225B43F2|nr:hypothetical protein [Streptomyces sp. NBC_00439]MCX5103541.1 hypothetical protein [Streptomyces sp. NBC_00439]